MNIPIRFLGENIMVIEEIRKYNKQLIAKYPWLLPRNVWTDEIVKDYDYSYTLLDDMPDGWRAAFGEQMCEEIQQVLNKFSSEVAEKFRITQIKEKFGGLRFYTNWSTVEIDKIIDKYENISYSTCIRCGSPAKWITKGWISPFCDNCKPDENCVEIEKFYT